MSRRIRFVLVVGAAALAIAVATPRSRRVPLLPYRAVLCATPGCLARETPPSRLERLSVSKVAA
jgi:hypothetical protein